MVLGSLPYIGPFFTMFSQLGPMLGAATAKSGAKGATEASGGQPKMDAATAAAMVASLGGTSSNALKSPELHSQLSPTLQVTGGGAQAVQAAFTAIGVPAAGAQLMRQLAGQDVSVVVLDDASYKKRSADKSIPPGTILVPTSALANSRQLTTLLVNGLARAAQNYARV
jgi:hypothetical protein